MPVAVVGTVQLPLAFQTWKVTISAARSAVARAPTSWSPTRVSARRQGTIGTNDDAVPDGVALAALTRADAETPAATRAKANADVYKPERLHEHALPNGWRAVASRSRGPFHQPSGLSIDPALLLVRSAWRWHSSTSGRVRAPGRQSRPRSECGRAEAGWWVT